MKYTHQKDYENRMRDQGLHRIGVWVPERDLDTVRAFAERLRCSYRAECAQLADDAKRLEDLL